MEGEDKERKGVSEEVLICTRLGAYRQGNPGV
jgi:hypothetical protein